MREPKRAGLGRGLSALMDEAGPAATRTVVPLAEIVANGKLFVKVFTKNTFFWVK